MDGPSLEHIFTVHFRGHPNVRATNEMTLEITRESYLTPRGDCIVGIMADAACKDLSGRAKGELRKTGSQVAFVIAVGADRFSFRASGSEALPLESPVSMVIRKSTYTCHRTLAVRSTAAASDLPRSMVAKLAGGSSGELLIYALRQ